MTAAPITIRMLPVFLATGDLAYHRDRTLKIVQSTVYKYDGQDLQYLGTSFTKCVRASRYHFDGGRLWFASSKRTDDRLQIHFHPIPGDESSAQKALDINEARLSVTLFLPNFDPVDSVSSVFSHSCCY